VLPAPFEEAVQRLDGIPGIDRRAAEGIVAEVGAGAEAFGSGAQLASWVGLCPGNNESAGKRYSGRTRKGDRWLRVLLVQCVWAASRKKGSALQALYQRLVGRRGKKRALVAVAHRLVLIIYNVLKKGERYKEFGPDYAAKPRDQERLKQRLLRRLEKLGVKVTVQPQEAVA